MMTAGTARVRTSAVWFWLLAGVLAAAGCGVGFAVRPIFEWMTAQFDSAPGPLVVAAQLPTVLAVTILSVAGAAFGLWIAFTMHIEGATLAVDEAGVQITSPKRNGFYPSDRVAAATKDGDDLVLLDARTTELVRVKADNLTTRALASAFRRTGYKWLAPHPFEFRPWIDGHPDLPEPLHRLLRNRSRALADQKSGTVDALTEQLRDSGVVVRDRGGAQGYRRTAS